MLAQATDLAASLLTYGPLGIICIWFMWRDDKRDKLQRETADKITAAIEGNTHKISGLSRALIFNAAAHASGGVKQMAEKELERMDAKGS